MILTIGLIMIGAWFYIIVTNHSRTQDAGKYIIGKYPLGEIKATLKATPDEPCKDFNDWQYQIFKLRNSK